MFNYKDRIFENININKLSLKDWFKVKLNKYLGIKVNKRLWFFGCDPGCGNDKSCTTEGYINRKGQIIITDIRYK